MIVAFTSFFLSFLTSIALIPLVMKVSQMNNWVDFPNSRKIHLFPISRQGGVGIFLSSIVLFPIISHFTVTDATQMFLIYGSIAAMSLGLVDDFFTLSAKQKLVGQVLLGLLTYFAGFQIHNVHFGFVSSLSLGFMSLPLTVLWVVVVMNAFNMIDGMDGLAASLAAVTFFSFGLLSSMHGNLSMAILCFLITGSVMGFFLYNFHPAKIFMGDGGSMLLGYLLSVVSIESLYQSTYSLAWVPLMFLAYPLLEFSVSVFRRVIKQIRIHRQYNPIKLISKAMSADGDHLHHRLLKLGLTQRKTNFLIVLYAITSCGLGFLLINMTFAVITAWFAFFVLISLLLVKLLNYEQFDRSQVKNEKDDYLLEKKFGRESLIKKVG